LRERGVGILKFTRTGKPILLEPYTFVKNAPISYIDINGLFGYPPGLTPGEAVGDIWMLALSILSV
jgi:hypothetical protein